MGPSQSAEAKIEPMSDQPSSARGEESETEGLASRVLSFQLQEVRDQIHRELASNASSFKVEFFTRQLEIISRTLEQFSGFITSGEAKVLESRIDTLKTDVGEVNLPRRIKERFSGVMQRAKDLGSRLEEATDHYSSPAEAKSAPDFQEALELLLWEWTVLHGEFERARDAFLPQLPVSSREKGQLMAQTRKFIYRVDEIDHEQALEIQEFVSIRRRFQPFERLREGRKR
jgi:hypothetical protein